MLGWLGRQQKRWRELSRGVDADLVRDNRRRYKWAGALIGLGLILVPVSRAVPPSGAIYDIVVGAAMGSWIAGVVLLHWAYRETVFLNRPDSEDPPKLFRK
jgi:hypothetical protein